MYKKGKVLSNILDKVKNGKKQYWILLDPDDFSCDEAAKISFAAQDCGADAILVGGSILNNGIISEFVKSIKKAVDIPVILFPGDATQITKDADAILFLSLVSGRNPVNLIGEHIKGAPLIKRYGIEPIPTAYMLVESGTITSVEFMSNTRPLPRAKPGIAVMHALASQYLGMELVYLEAGSGAKLSVPAEMIYAVKKNIDIPVIVGGGIKDEIAAKEKIDAGADIIVTGNMLKYENGLDTMKKISSVIHS